MAKHFCETPSSLAYLFSTDFMNASAIGQLGWPGNPDRVSGNDKANS